MDKFVFDGFDRETDNSASTEGTQNDSFLDFVEGYDYSNSKFVKKAMKSVKKQKKKIKKLSSNYKDLEKEVTAIKADIKSLKKSAYVSKIAELVNSDNITERKRLANELYKMEV